MFSNPDYYHIHFIGIGGIGVSAIARMFLAEGKEVSGSDQTLSPITEGLARLGAKIFYGHRSEQVTPETELAVYSIAVPTDNPEFARARELGIPVRSYPEMLGEISKNKFTIAVSGTHGKTTTTAMVAKIFIEAGLDPTVIIGSLVNFGGSGSTNFLAGKSRYLIVEACEYRRSFLHLRPRILVITNIDNDHLDYYRDLADIQTAFAELARRVPADGRVITEREYRRVKLPVVLGVPGEHNQRNAQAALAAAAAAGIGEDVGRRALASFRGAWRRFEYKGEMSSGAKVFDDYAHHPTEIKATLAAAEEIAPGKIFVVFQPHLYSRTKILFNDFAKSFTLADEVIVTDIYAARETRDNTVTAEGLTQAIVKNGQNARHLKTFAEIKKYLQKTSRGGDLILTLGAGNIFELAEDLV